MSLGQVDEIAWFITCWYKLAVFQEWIEGIPDFLHVDTNSHALKVDQKMFGWVWSEMGVASLVTGLLKLAVFQEWIEGITDFLHAGANSGKLKVISMVLGWA